jgi:hypothetical protein
VGVIEGKRIVGVIEREEDRGCHREGIGPKPCFAHFCGGHPEGFAYPRGRHSKGAFRCRELCMEESDDVLNYLIFKILEEVTTPGVST